MEKANHRQVGGQHYQATWQHWDFVEEIRLGYLECQATRYVIRWRKKDGVKDLEKADHYIQKLIEIGRPNLVIRSLAERLVPKFIKDNIPRTSDAAIFMNICLWIELNDLLLVREMLKDLIEKNKVPAEDSNKHAER